MRDPPEQPGGKPAFNPHPQIRIFLMQACQRARKNAGAGGLDHTEPERAAGDRTIVGVNEYVDPNEDRQIDILTISEEVETVQVDRLKEFKDRRDNAAASKALDTIREAARNGDNVMPSLIEGALANCTLGEMVQAMADIYGRYTGGPEW